MAGDRCTDSATSLQVCKLGGAHGRLRSLGTGSGWPPKGCLHPLDRRLLDSLSSSPGSGGFRVHPRSTSAPWALGTQTVCSTGRRAGHSRANRHISTSTGQGCCRGKQTGRDLGVGFREQNRNTLAGGEQAPEEVGGPGHWGLSSEGHGGQQSTSHNGGGLEGKPQFCPYTSCPKCPLGTHVGTASGMRCLCWEVNGAATRAGPRGHRRGREHTTRAPCCPRAGPTSLQTQDEEVILAPRLQSSPVLSVHQCKICGQKRFERSRNLRQKGPGILGKYRRQCVSLSLSSGKSTGRTGPCMRLPGQGCLWNRTPTRQPGLRGRQRHASTHAHERGDRPSAGY